MGLTFGMIDEASCQSATNEEVYERIKQDILRMRVNNFNFLDAMYISLPWTDGNRNDAWTDSDGNTLNMKKPAKTDMQNVPHIFVLYDDAHNVVQVVARWGELAARCWQCRVAKAPDKDGCNLEHWRTLWMS